MSDYKFSVGEYLTRDGRKAVVLADDIAGEEPLLGVVINHDGSKKRSTWYPNGNWWKSAENSDADLMPPAPAKPEPVERWVNLYSHPERAATGTVCYSEPGAAEDAREWRASGWTHLCTIRVSSDPEPGYAEGWDAGVERAANELHSLGHYYSEGIIRRLKGKAHE